MNIVIRKNRIVTIAMALIFISAFVFLFIPATHASLGTWLANAVEELSARIVSGHGVWIAEIFTNTAWTDTVGLLKTIMSSTTVIGGSFMLLYLLIEVINEAKNGKVTTDLLFATGIKMVVGLTLLLFCGTLISSIEGAMKAIVSLFANTWKQETLSSVSPIEFSYNPLAFILNLVSVFAIRILLLPLSWLIELVIKVTSYSLLLELNLRKVFIPIAIAGVVHNGERSPGVSYIKKWAALYIRMAILISAFYLAGLIPVTQFASNKDFLDAAFNATFGVALLDVSALLFSSKAAAMANEIMGV